MNLLLLSHILNDRGILLCVFDSQTKKITLTLSIRVFSFTMWRRDSETPGRKGRPSRGLKNWRSIPPSEQKLAMAALVIFEKRLDKLFQPSEVLGGPRPSTRFKVQSNVSIPRFPSMKSAV